jgi:hypothetical protein
MEYERYEFEKGSSEFEYVFYSLGPKGRIKKVVNFEKIEDPGFRYNLSFTDWDEKLRQKSDEVVTNNQDRDKVLATVAVIAIDFILTHPDFIIIALGRTISRVRLYQMGITRVIDNLDPKFVIEGYLNNEWVSFEKGLNFEAFKLKIKS